MTRETFAQWVRAEKAFAEAVDNAEAEYLLGLELTAHSLARGNLKVSTEKVTKYFKDGTVQSVTEKETVKPPSETMVMFLLERRDHEQYGRRDTLKLVPPEKMKDEELADELSALLSRLGLAERSQEAGVDAPEES